tara:strand:+ start:23228 stop:23920 length:693 start_codon:yes stop_codon:yes gene_type:complete
MSTHTERMRDMKQFMTLVTLFAYATTMFLGCGVIENPIPSYEMVPVAASPDNLKEGCVVATKRDWTGAITRVDVVLCVNALPSKESKGSDFGLRGSESINIDLQSKVEKKLQAKLSMFNVDTVSLTFTDVVLKSIWDIDWFYVINELMPTHIDIIKERKKQGYSIEFVTDVFLAKGKLSWSYKDKNSASVNVELDKKITAALGIEYTAEQSGEVSGEGLVWAIKTVPLKL